MIKMYEVVRDDKGGSSYTTFDIWGPGKLQKFSAIFLLLCRLTSLKRIFSTFS